MNPTNDLLVMISLPEYRQPDIAFAYARTLQSQSRERTDWHAVNMAIIERWSFSGLERVKKLAWNHIKSDARR